jgi:(2R)-3-sulfolactate dehydrogenase (NADP+)
MAKSIVEATVSAAWHGRPEVGFAHFLDYLESLRGGRIDGKAAAQIDALHSPHSSIPMPAGELGYYVRRLAAEGLISMAVANAHATCRARQL